MRLLPALTPALLLSACLLSGCHRTAAPCAVDLSADAVDPHAPAEIESLLQKQASDWNRGDLPAFASGYKNSPDILFIGSRISRGYGQMLEGYRTAYPTSERMGTLTFTNLEVQPIRSTLATATGHFHLERTAGGGGNAEGYFLLVLEKTPAGWRIIRDDTTALPPHPAPHGAAPHLKADR